MHFSHSSQNMFTNTLCKLANLFSTIIIILKYWAFFKKPVDFANKASEVMHCLFLNILFIDNGFLGLSRRNINSSLWKKCQRVCVNYYTMTDFLSKIQVYLFGRLHYWPSYSPISVMTILVCFGYCNKISSFGWLKQQNCVFSQF
jgi:hypothetical protein